MPWLIALFNTAVVGGIALVLFYAAPAPQKKKVKA